MFQVFVIKSHMCIGNVNKKLFHFHISKPILTFLIEKKKKKKKKNKKKKKKKAICGFFFLAHGIFLKMMDEHRLQSTLGHNIWVCHYAWRYLK